MTGRSTKGWPATPPFPSSWPPRRSPCALDNNGDVAVLHAGDCTGGCGKSCLEACPLAVRPLPSSYLRHLSRLFAGSLRRRPPPLDDGGPPGR